MIDTDAIYSLDALRQRFCRLWEQCALSQVDSSAVTVWDELVQHYNEPHRHYHTLAHLGYCMSQLDLVSSMLEDPAATEMALWFHDVIFKPGACDNEQNSADLFGRIAGAEFASDLVQRVSDLICATTHCNHPQSVDERYTCDIDLSSLGLPWDAFLKDSLDVRAEQAETSDVDFIPAQTRFLNGLLERPAIFFTEFFQARYETAARENIRRYIARMNKSGDD